jgi:hypothetical protein
MHKYCFEIGILDINITFLQNYLILNCTSFE